MIWSSSYTAGKITRERAAAETSQQRDRTAGAFWRGAFHARKTGASLGENTANVHLSPHRYATGGSTPCTLFPGRHPLERPADARRADGRRLYPRRVARADGGDWVVAGAAGRKQTARGSFADNVGRVRQPCPPQPSLGISVPNGKNQSSPGPPKSWSAALSSRTVPFGRDLSFLTNWIRPNSAFTSFVQLRRPSPA